MAKYKVGDIFINHNDGKILQVYEGGCDEGCCYSGCCYKTFPFSKDITCTSLVGMPNHIKELPFLPLLYLSSCACFLTSCMQYLPCR